ncbi:hypothetical protein EMIT093MI4_70111 [Pseudomonas sp. IT-93MI4]
MRARYPRVAAHLPRPARERSVSDSFQRYFTQAFEARARSTKCLLPEGFFKLIKHLKNPATCSGIAPCNNLIRH